ncbi:hypothetical protein IFR05_008529 [Cadophora sp. M221]|nr:hypothetical protein IFR05_008529 [Cadophora sp. M221]
MIRHDMETYLDHRLKNSRFRSWTSELKDHVKQRLVSRADGMYVGFSFDDRTRHNRFRLVALHLDDLTSCWNESKIRARIEHFPKTLERFYQCILREIDEEDFPQSLQGLRPLAHARRNISLAKLTEAMVVDPDKSLHVSNSNRFMNIKDVLQILPAGLVLRVRGTVLRHSAANGQPCKLIVKNEKSSASGGVVRLTHYSVLQYLSSNRIQSTAVSFFHLDVLCSRQNIAQLCLAYLHAVAEYNDSSAHELYQTFPFLHYAAIYLVSHLKVLEAEPVPLSLQQLSRAFLNSKSGSGST